MSPVKSLKPSGITPANPLFGRDSPVTLPASFVSTPYQLAGGSVADFQLVLSPQLAPSRLS